MCATLCCQRWIVSVNLNCHLWPKLREVWTQQSLFTAFCIDGPVFSPKNYVTPSWLSSLKLHRQQQYTSQTEFDYRGTAPPPHQWSSCWSEHKHPAGKNRRNSNMSQNDSPLLLTADSNGYQIRLSNSVFLRMDPSVSPPLWAKNNQMDCHEIMHRHLCSPEDESNWTLGYLIFPLVAPWGWYLSQMSWHLFDGLSWKILLVPKGWILMI